MTRVVSLVPSVTESLLAWGVEPVAVTRFCEQPGLRTVGGTKNPDLDAIVALRPDLVVVDEEENTLPAAESLAAAGLALHVTHVRSVADVAPTLSRLATAVGVDGAVPGTARIAPGGPLPGPRLRAWVPIWRRPWMSVNAATYGSSVLDAVGVDNISAGAEVAYPVQTIDDVTAAGPEVVLAPSEPYGFTERHRRELEAVAPVLFVDGKDLFWWGVRTPGALQRLRARVEGWARAR